MKEKIGSSGWPEVGGQEKKKKNPKKKEKKKGKRKARSPRTER